MIDKKHTEKINMAYDHRFSVVETDKYLKICFGNVVVFEAELGRGNQEEIELRIEKALKHFGCESTLEELRGKK